MIYRARFIVPSDGPPIENGALVVDAGRITFVGQYGDLSETPIHAQRPRIDFGDAVILPGLVNAHTHLELTDLAGRVAPSCDFTAWLRSLFTLLSGGSRDEHTITSATCAGVQQSLAAGVTTVGDITRYPAWTRSILAASPLRTVSFGEVAAIGRRRHLLAERLHAACEPPSGTASRLRIGISPHAPYTVEPAALRICLDAARTANLPVCMHVGEVVDEDRFTCQLEGTLADYLRELGLWDDQITAHGCRSVELLTHYPFPAERTLLAHVNYASDAAIELLARHGASVAYCPRTHAAFGHPPHRFCDMLAAGVNVCLGTDSLASNPSLSILDEIRFLHTRFPDVSPELLVALATEHGARALGLAEIAGSLTVGKRGDFVVVPLETGCAAHDWTSILASATNPSDVFVDGMKCA